MLIGQNFCERWLQAAVPRAARGTSRRIFLPRQTVDSLPERESLQTLLCARVQGAERDAAIDIASPGRRERTRPLYVGCLLRGWFLGFWEM